MSEQSLVDEWYQDQKPADVEWLKADCGWRDFEHIHSKVVVEIKELWHAQPLKNQEDEELLDCWLSQALLQQPHLQLEQGIKAWPFHLYLPISILEGISLLDLLLISEHLSIFHCCLCVCLKLLAEQQALGTHHDSQHETQGKAEMCLANGRVIGSKEGS